MRLRILGAVVVLLSALGATTARAEVYLGIQPQETLAELRLRFPGARFSAMQVAWALDEDLLYLISGPGISGDVIVKLTDHRVIWRKRLAEAPESEDAPRYREWLRAAGEERITTDWVRWIPWEPVPLSRFVAKYGRPDGSGIADDDLRPYKFWKRGIHAILDNGERVVVQVDFHFTPEESEKAHRARQQQAPAK